MAQQLLKHTITANRRVDLPRYGGVPLYLSIFQLLNTGEATPAPTRVVISVEIGGFGLVMYAAGLVQSLSPMTALHTAVEAAEAAATQLADEFRNEFKQPGRSPLHTLQAKGVVFSLAMHGTPEAAPDFEAGTQRTTEIAGEDMAAAS
jgi:hypothetical protein